MKTINLKYNAVSPNTRRPYWNMFKTKRPGYSKYRKDSEYNTVLNTGLSDKLDWSITYLLIICVRLVVIWVVAQLG